MSYRLFVNAESTVLVRIWDDGSTVEVAIREDRHAIWGPPIPTFEEHRTSG